MNNYIWDVGKDYRLSPHFLLSEFLVSRMVKGYSRYFAQPKIYQKPLFEHISSLLERVREYSGKIIITSGYRDMDILAALIEAKYKISIPRTENGKLKGTDHTYLDPEVYPFGVGAADFITIDTLDTFKWIISNKKLLKDIGQVIYYKEWNFIHLGNPKKLVFNKYVIDKWFSPKIKILLYKNQGYYPYKQGDEL